MIGVLQDWIGRDGRIGMVESKNGIAEEGIEESERFPEELLGICRGQGGRKGGGASWDSSKALGELLCICVGSDLWIL